MNEPLSWILIGLCIAWGAQAVLAVVAQRKLAHLAANPQTDRFAAYRPATALIVPFKGVEPALKANIQGLFTQDYPNYRLLLIVEDESDPAYPVLRDAIKQHPDRQADIVFAGVAGPNEGQKVHNLLAAIEKLKQEDAGEEVWAFADSDAVPGPNWLAALVGPLANKERTAVTTGFRWLIPEDASGDNTGGTFWSKIASILNSSTAGFIRRDSLSHAWGGSMAMRVSTAIEGDLVGRWQGAISDDYQVTRMCRDLKRRVYFVPECLVASPASYDLAQLREFAYRQYVITRIHAPVVYYAAVAINALYFVGLAAACTLLIRHEQPEHTALALTILVLVFLANQLRATYRARVVKLTFSPQTADQLKPTLRLDRWATPLYLGVNLLLLLSAAFSNTITWRNIRYRINAPQDIQRLDP